MRVVVTGATGNVGTALLRALVDEPEVTQIVGLARRRPDMHPPKVTWVQADVSSDPLEPHLRGADAVVHLAWLIQPGRDEEVAHATNVEGTRRVAEAVAAADVPALVYASSVGSYAPGPKDRMVDESWPTTGVPTAFYSRHKAATERMLDAFEQRHPGVRVVRLRTALIFQRSSASEQRRFFAGPFVPGFLLRPSLIPVVPTHPRLRFQALHADDAGQAYRLAILRDVRGAFNVAADPVLDGEELARILGARPVPVSSKALRLAADLTFRAHLQPSEPGWVDMAFQVPLMDTTRARQDLGWQPTRSAGDVILELLEGMREGAGDDTPPLRPGGAGPARLREVLTGVGGTSR